MIKGMKMPKNCKGCRFRGFGGIRNEFDVCSLTGRNAEENSYEKYLPDCPLVEVQEKHGGLIDADVLCVDITETADPIYSDMIEWAIGMVEAQSTVIEAEGE